MLHAGILSSYKDPLPIQKRNCCICVWHFLSAFILFIEHGVPWEGPVKAQAPTGVSQFALFLSSPTLPVSLMPPSALLATYQGKILVQDYPETAEHRTQDLGLSTAGYVPETGPS